MHLEEHMLLPLMEPELAVRTVSCQSRLHPLGPLLLGVAWPPASAATKSHVPDCGWHATSVLAARWTLQVSSLLASIQLYIHSLTCLHTSLGRTQRDGGTETERERWEEWRARAKGWDPTEHFPRSHGKHLQAQGCPESRLQAYG